MANANALWAVASICRHVFTPEWRHVLITIRRGRDIIVIGRAASTPRVFNYGPEHVS